MSKFPLEYNGIPLEEYFRYHPPQSQERKDKHERINRDSFALCQKMFSGLDDPDSLSAAISTFKNSIPDLTSNQTCLKWAERSLDTLLVVSSQKESPDVEESILMHIQQVRMFLNQGATMDEVGIQL